MILRQKERKGKRRNRRKRKARKKKSRTQRKQGRKKEKPVNKKLKLTDTGIENMHKDTEEICTERGKIHTDTKMTVGKKENKVQKLKDTPVAMKNVKMEKITMKAETDTGKENKVQKLKDTQVVVTDKETEETTKKAKTDTGNKNKVQRLKDTQVVMTDIETKKTSETDTGKETIFQKSTTEGQKSTTDGQTERTAVNDKQAGQVLTQKMNEKAVPKFKDDTRVWMTGEETSTTKKIGAKKEQKLQTLNNMLTVVTDKEITETGKRKKLLLLLPTTDQTDKMT